MAKKSVNFGGNPNNRMSAVVSGDKRRYGGGKVTRSDFAGNLQQGFGGGGLGMPVNSIARSARQPKDQSRVPSEQPRAIARAPKPAAPQKTVSLVGGLGMQAYKSDTAKTSLRTAPTADTAGRDRQYGGGKTAAAAKLPPARQVIRTTADVKDTPARKPAPQRTGGLGITTGKTTGSSATRAGTGGLTRQSAYARMTATANAKSGNIGPSRSGGSKKK